MCNCVESEVAAFFANKHIAAYLPNEAMQEGAAWGKEAYERQVNRAH